MALIKKLHDSKSDVEWYGEPVISFREEFEFEVDGIVYRYPEFEESELGMNRSVTVNNMFDLYEA